MPEKLNESEKRMTQQRGSCGETPDSNTRINGYIERAAIWAFGILFTILVYVVQGQSAEIKALDVKVQALAVEKVDKRDLKELETRLTYTMSTMKSDMRDMLELYLGKRK